MRRFNLAMLRVYLAWFLTALIFLSVRAVPSVYAAGIASLVKDIHTGASTAIVPAQIVAFNNAAYVVVDDPLIGAELWRSNGTAGGTALVADLCPGVCGSSPSSLVVVGSTLYFSANNGDSGTELWKLSGGAPSLVADLLPGAASAALTSLTNVGGSLFFVANDTSGVARVWRSSGTAETTSIVSPAGLTNPGELRAVGSTLFFVGTASASGTELWRVNGETASLVGDIAPGTDSSRPTSLTAVGGALFFTADDGVRGRELWRSDDTGTTLVKDIRPGSESSGVKELTAVGNTLFFSATEDATGTELWRSDGTVDGTALVRDIYAGGETAPLEPFSPFSSAPKFLTAVGNTLFFRAQDAAHGYELWRSSGTAATTVLVSDINPGVENAAPTNLTAVGTTLFFRADDEVDGRELWKVSGTGTPVRVKNINPGDAHGDPTLLTAVGNTLFFAANDGNGVALWTSDGSSPGTTLITRATSIGAVPDELIEMGGQVFFAATSASGRELWRSNGTSAGTVQVKDIRTGPGSSSPRELTTVGSTLFFIADNEAGVGLWKTDGTTTNTQLVYSAFRTGSEGVPPANLVNMNGVLFFTASHPTKGHELWRSDGTTAGTSVIDVLPGEDSAAPHTLVAANGLLYFVAQTEDVGEELWRSDGTPVGTTLVRDIYPGAVGSAPQHLFAANGRIFFSADNGTNGRELWSTASGITAIVRDIAPGAAGSVPSDFAAMDGIVYFAAQDATGGRELWKTNGLVVTTVRVKDIAAGAASSAPQELTSANGRVFFRANDSTTGSELWSTDGTELGTTLAADIQPGAVGAVPQSIRQVRASGRVLFSASTTAHGAELWISDGTATGTTLLHDIAGGSASANPTQFTVVGAVANPYIVFRAQDTQTGAELWAVPTTSLNTAPIATGSTIAVHVNRPFTGLLNSTDAERDMLTITLRSQPTQGSVVLTNATTGAFTYTPKPGFLGTDSFTYSISDGLAESVVATVTANVTNVAPALPPASFTIHANRVLNGTLAATDADNDVLTYRVASGASKGTVVLTNATTGAFTYTPGTNQLGADSFVVLVNDSVADSAPATMSVEITNTAPIAEDLDKALPFDTAFTGTLVASDADGDALTFSIVSNGSKGVAAITNAATGAFTYTPNAGARGIDTVMVKANDGLADSNTATVTIAFGNAAPVAYDFAATTAMNGQLRAQLRATDADVADTLTYTLAFPASNGVAVIDAATGIFTYTPQRNFKGTDTFRFTVSDGKTRSSAATVTITVGAAGAVRVYLPVVQR